MPKKVAKKKLLPYRMERVELPTAPLYEEVEVRHAVQPQIALMEPDLLDQQYGLAFLAAADRIMAFARQTAQESNPESFIRNVLARLCVKDPKIKLILAIIDGEIVGHILATIETDGTSTWAFCWQAQVDPKGTGTLQYMMDAGIEWAKQHGATSILMATHLDPAFWEQKYGFTSTRTVMRRPI